MIVVLSFLQDRIEIADRNIKLIYSDDVSEAGGYYDVALFESDSRWDLDDFLDISENKKIFRLYVLGEDEALEDGGFFDGVIKQSSLHEIASKLITLERELLLRKELYSRDMELQQFYVHLGVHIGNFEMVKSVLSGATKKIEQNFEDKMSRLKKINADLKAIGEQNDALAPTVKEVDSVVRGLFNYVSILQCEDRIFQMMDGVKNIMYHDMLKIKSKNIEMNDLVKNRLMKDMVPFYTIQEQRDFALGIDVADSLADSEAGKVIIF